MLLQIDVQGVVTFIIVNLSFAATVVLIFRSLFDERYLLHVLSSKKTIIDCIHRWIALPPCSPPRRLASQSQLNKSFANARRSNEPGQMRIKSKSHFYPFWMLSFPSFIKLYRISVLLFIPISKPREIINSKSNTMVASTVVELLT